MSISRSSSACLSLRCRRRLPRSSSTTRLASGLTAFSLRPRRLGDRPASSPRSHARRQVTRCDECSPSRRSNARSRPHRAPHPPPAQCAACTPPRIAAAQPSPALPDRQRARAPGRRRARGNLRSPYGLPAFPPRTACYSSIASICSMIVSAALYTNFKEGRCLTYIGREGCLSCMRWRGC